MIAGDTARQNLPKTVLARILGQLPHGPELQCIEEVTQYDRNSITCIASLEGRAFPETARGGEHSVLISLECIAQAAAIGQMLGGRSPDELPDNPPRQVGAIVRIRDFTFEQADVPLSGRFRVTANWSSPVSGAFEVNGSLIDATVPERKYASGSFTIVVIS
jgi:hypothetical protein